MMRSLTAKLMTTGAIVAVLFGGLLPTSSTAQQSPPYAEQSERPTRSRARANDAYRPGPDQAGLGVLGGDGRAEPAPAYGAAPAGPSPYPPPSYSGAPSYGAPAYNAPPTYSAAPSYGSPTPSYERGPSVQNAQGYGSPPPYRPPYQSGQQPYDQQPSYGNDPYRSSGQGGFGQPYATPPAYDDEPAAGRRPYMSGERYRDAPPPGEYRQGNSYSIDEITHAGHGFFGSITQGLASTIEHTHRKKGRPNGYILGEEAGGAFVAGLRYGRGRLYTKDAGVHNIYWQGPSLGFDAGADGSKVMILVYNLQDIGEVYHRFGGIDGSAYVVGGVGVTFLSKEHVVMAPIRSGVGLRFGANIGYLKFTSQPTWNPF